MVETVIITIVQTVFSFIYSKGSDLIIHMMNIKYNQEYYDTVALTTILYECFASYLPIFVIAFFVDNPMGKLYILML